MKFKKALSVGLSVSMLAGMAVTVQAAEVNEDVKGELVIWEHLTSFEPALEAIIEGFQKKYPNVDVEYEIKDSEYYSLLATAIQAGEAPDVFWTNGTATSQMGEYVAQDAVLDITDLVDMGELEAEALDLATIDGKRYSVPWMTFDGRGVYYNKKMFEEMGIEIPKTFEEFEAALQTIKDNGKIPIALAGMSSWDILFFIEPLLSAVEPEYTRNLVDYSKAKAYDANFGNALNKMLEWAEKGYFGEGWLGVDYDGMCLSFTMEEAAMCITGTWEISSFAENNPDLDFGGFQIPTAEGTSGMVGTYANGFSVYKNTENQEAAVAFLNYCASLEAQTTWVQTIDAVSGSPKIEAKNPVANEMTNCDEKFVSWQGTLSKYNKEGASATTVWDEDSTKVASGAMSVEEFLSTLKDTMQ